MVSKSKNGDMPYWLNEDIWDTMWEYWNSVARKSQSRIAANNRMSNQNGFVLHKHTAGSRSFTRVRHSMNERDGVEPSMLQVLRETHRRCDGTYVDARAQYVDDEIQRQIEVASHTLGSGSTCMTQLEEDAIYLQLVPPSKSGYVFGVGGRQPICERGESSSMAANRVSLERQVASFQQQLSVFLQYMKQSEGNQNTSTSWQGSMGPATCPPRGLESNDTNHSNENMEAAILCFER